MQATLPEGRHPEKEATPQSRHARIFDGAPAILATALADDAAAPANLRGRSARYSQPRRRKKATIPTSRTSMAPTTT
jgi:hypothetical protein